MQWWIQLVGENPEVGWQGFLVRHNPILLRVAGRRARDLDEQMDRFTAVISGLREQEFMRLRRFDPAGPAPFKPWLIRVTQRLIIDFLRCRDGRPQSNPPEGLTALGLEIWRRHFEQMMPLAETLGVLSNQTEFAGLTDGAFAREVADVTRVALAQRRIHVVTSVGRSYDVVSGAASLEWIPDPAENQTTSVIREEVGLALQAVLLTLDADTRAAVILRVVHGESVAVVAQALGWEPAQVYQRVSRALKRLREELVSLGWGPE